jgi:hypothetical protein
MNARIIGRRNCGGGLVDGLEGRFRAVHLAGGCGAARGDCVRRCTLNDECGHRISRVTASTLIEIQNLHICADRAAIALIVTSAANCSHR